MPTPQEVITLLDEHECIGEECTLPAGLFFMADDSAGDGVNTAVIIHKLTPNQIAETLIRMWDDFAMKALSQELPDYIRFAFGRDELRRSVESVPPPGEVSEQLNHLANQED